MKKIIQLLGLVIVITLSIGFVKLQAQIYHEECKEDLRAFMRQGNNYEILSLTKQDTATWYENEDWVPKIKHSSPYAGNGISWVKTEDSVLRIKSVDWESGYYYSITMPSEWLTGKLKLRSPVLTTLWIRRNNISELDISDNVALTYVECNENNLSELKIGNNPNLEGIECSDNILTKLDIHRASALKYLVFDNNNLSELDISNNPQLCTLSCKYNYFKFSTLSPDIIGLYGKCLLIYYPQKDAFTYLNIKDYTDTVDLSSEYDINGTITNYEWFELDGVSPYWECKEIVQPINQNGVFYFNEKHIDKKLICKMTNAQIPKLELKCFVYFKYTGIEEVIMLNSLIFPNPTNSNATLMLDLETSGNLTIMLSNVFGQELFELFNGFANTGTFNNTFSLEALPSGVYYLKIMHNGSTKTEKIVKK